MDDASDSALVLASASPRRRELLAQLGFAFRCASAEIDEAPRVNEQPVDYVERLAREKAEAVHRDPAVGIGSAVLAADTTVCVGGALLGKPRGAAEAAQMLAGLSGRWHQVVTGLALIGRQVQIGHCVTEVLFRAITQFEASAYWATGEPCDKAGGYAIQGLGALFVERIEGSYSNVVGLPLFETGRFLAKEGLTPWTGGGAAVGSGIGALDDATTRDIDDGVTG